MKKHILSLAFAATMLGALATGCSSANKTGGTDSTTVVKDSTKVTDTTKVIDTVKKDSTKKDSTKQ